MESGSGSKKSAVEPRKMEAVLLKFGVGIVRYKGVLDGDTIFGIERPNYDSDRSLSKNSSNFNRINSFLSDKKRDTNILSPISSQELLNNNVINYKRFSPINSLNKNDNYDIINENKF
jgi:hypothetical protein